MCRLEIPKRLPGEYGEIAGRAAPRAAGDGQQIVRQRALPPISPNCIRSGTYRARSRRTSAHASPPHAKYVRKVLMSVSSLPNHLSTLAIFLGVRSVSPFLKREAFSSSVRS